jgi:hypothetical protein
MEGVTRALENAPVAREQSKSRSIEGSIAQANDQIFQLKSNTDIDTEGMQELALLHNAADEAVLVDNKRGSQE